MFGQDGGLQRGGALGVVDSHEHEVVRGRPFGKVTRSFVVTYVLVAVSDHGTPAIPALSTHDVNFLGEKRVGCSHNRADVEIVRQVLDRHMKGMPT